ncbi:unannotated protein [freshwater metagenome]|uniref:Unannotated protein n=1 Tax=freshwater metagenome TaxID=449393 RepID=A0A6J6VQG8_9ZZZZ|nr:DUF2975 domain-containing protein [Nocardioides sp.]MSY86531.1 DUF2975 domain-containing protein [Actinomycetota bacterium]
MNPYVVAALRTVLALGLAGSLFVQAVMVPLLFLDLDDASTPVRVQVVAIVLLGIVAVQVVMVCTWRLLTLVGRDEVFSPRSFRYVDTISGAVVAAALLLFWLGAVAAPGEDVAPGVVLLVGGAGGLVLGAALVVRVMRALLVQAVGMRDELAEVI